MKFAATHIIFYGMLTGIWIVVNGQTPALNGFALGYSAFTVNTVMLGVVSWGVVFGMGGKLFLIVGIGIIKLFFVGALVYGALRFFNISAPGLVGGVICSLIVTVGYAYFYRRQHIRNGKESRSRSN